MSEPEMMLKAIKLKGRIGPNQKLEIIEKPVDLPEGSVEVILIYSQDVSSKKIERPSPSTWPTLKGGRYLGGNLSREEIYDDDGR
jgi:hypothetical protein